MPKKSYTINDPFLNQFIFDCLWTSTKDQRIKLKGTEIKHLKSDKTARNFATKSTFEEKIALLARLNVPFFFGFGTMDNKVLTDIHKRYKEEKSLAAINAIIEKKVFVVTSKEVMMYLSLMASNVHSDSWVMNRDYLKMGYHVNNWRKDVVTPSDDATNESLHSARQLAKVMVNSVLLSKFGEEWGGLNEVGICILLFAFSKNKFDLVESDIRTFFEPMYYPSKITLSIKKCLANHYLMQSFKDPKRKAYRLTGLGVDAAMSFQKKAMTLAGTF
jgi:hypothetical protein